MLVANQAVCWLDRDALFRLQTASKHFYMVVIPSAMAVFRVFDRQNILLMTNSAVMRILDKEKMCWCYVNLA